MIHFDAHLGLSDLPQIVAATIRDLTPRTREFDSIAVQGVSGMIVGAPVALALRKPLVVVRKDEDMTRPCYHVSEVEGAGQAGSRVLFLDDYVGRGSSLDDVIRKLARSTHATVSARYEYADGKYLTGPEARRAPLREYA